MAQNEKEARLLLELCQYWNPAFPDGIIISSFFLDQHTVTPTAWEKQCCDVRLHQSLTITHLVQRLTQLGFERWPRAVSARSFAVRGNVLDVIDRQAVRVEFDDNRIAAVNLFNPNTQQSGTPMKQYRLWPLAYASHLPLWHEQNLQYQFVTPKYYHKRFALLKKEAGGFLKIQVATRYPDRVRAILPDAQLTSWRRQLEGFIIPQDHFLFLTDDHIFGQEDLELVFAEPLDVTDLQPGDYVVHIDHGIALFDKLTTLDGEQFFELHYDKGDKLYVPLTKANRVEKYIGSDRPKLTRLSGAQWETIIHKVEEDVQQTARELLELQAEREVATAVSLTDHATTEEDHIAGDVNFELTADQIQAITDVRDDLTKTTPMDRLLCGDVGFGKTEIALRAAAHVVLHGGQVALLAPTTILVQQHFETFQQRLTAYGIVVASLSRLHSAKEQTNTVRQLAKGQIDIVIGTHRLLSNDITIPKLNLVIIDEEQRFGVKHKERLRTMRAAAHVLTMTATPIPRTLNLALSGLRSISVLNTAPANRRGVKTIINVFVPELELQAVTEELERHGQVYIVHNNLITIYARQAWLRQQLPTATIAIAHGQMEPVVLAKTMRQFHAGQIDVLLASTIIENGLDIANANTLIVEQAEDFGLAQLYQLRGRIGRSATQAYAYLLYQSDHLTVSAKRRLKALHSVKELGGGFELAMKDLEIRGVGDILGKKQHGHVQHIGLNLYTRLLQHAITQLQSDQVTAK